MIGPHQVPDLIGFPNENRRNPRRFIIYVILVISIVLFIAWVRTGIQ